LFTYSEDLHLRIYWFVDSLKTLLHVIIYIPAVLVTMTYRHVVNLLHLSAFFSHLYSLSFYLLLVNSFCLLANCKFNIIHVPCSKKSHHMCVCLFVYMCGEGISVGIATDYGVEGPGSNPGGDESFPSIQSDPGAHPAFCKTGTESFPVVKCGRVVLLTIHPF
jgi:hypothetical protein